MDKVKFVEDSFQKIWSDMVCLTPSVLKVVFQKFYLVHSWILCPKLSVAGPIFITPLYYVCLTLLHYFPRFGIQKFSPPFW